MAILVDSKADVAAFANYKPEAGKPASTAPSTGGASKPAQGTHHENIKGEPRTNISSSLISHIFLCN